MSANKPSNESLNTPARTTGGASTGATDAGTTRATPGSSSMTTGAGSSSSAAGSKQGATAVAQEYGQKISDAATQAKDYVSEKMSVVGDKFKDLQNRDFGEVAEEAKQYARQKPGQALLISAAAGFIIGMLLRGSRR